MDVLQEYELSKAAKDAEQSVLGGSSKPIVAAQPVTSFNPVTHEVKKPVTKGARKSPNTKFVIIRRECDKEEISTVDGDKSTFEGKNVLEPVVVNKHVKKYARGKDKNKVDKEGAGNPLDPTNFIVHSVLTDLAESAVDLKDEDAKSKEDVGNVDVAKYKHKDEDAGKSKDEDAVKPVSKKKDKVTDVKDVGGKARPTKQPNMTEDKDKDVADVAGTARPVKKSKQSSDKEAKVTEVKVTEFKDVGGKARPTKQAKVTEDKDKPANVTDVKDVAKPANLTEVKDVGVKAKPANQAKMTEVKDVDNVVKENVEGKDQDASNAPVCADVSKKVVKPVNNKKAATAKSEHVVDKKRKVGSDLVHLSKKVKYEDSVEDKKGIKRVKKNVKKEAFDDVVTKKGKKVMAVENAADQDIYPKMNARTNAAALRNAIQPNPWFDMSLFLDEIGFSSFKQLKIDTLPMRLGHYAVTNCKDCKMEISPGNVVEVTPSKVKDILGIPNGAVSLLSLPEREDGFVKEWAKQFDMPVKKVRIWDISRKLVACREVDFMFKLNFLTLFTNSMCKMDGLSGELCMDVVKRIREDTVIADVDWCGYLIDCLKQSKVPNYTNYYIGPFTFLILLYIDSTNFPRLPILRARPAIQAWSTALLKQREDFEIEDGLIGCLEPNPEFTQDEVENGEGFVLASENSKREDLLTIAEEKLTQICKERAYLEAILKRAYPECHGGGRFVDIVEKYSTIFKNPMSFDDDGNGVYGNGDDDDENDNGNDDENDDGEGNHGDGNGDDDFEKADVNPNCSNDTFGWNKITSIDQLNTDSCPSQTEPSQTKSVEEGKVNADDNVNEGNVNAGNVEDVKEVDDGNHDSDGDGDEEFDPVMSTPESFTQFLYENYDFVFEHIDCVVDEYNYGDLLDAIAEDMRQNNEGIRTPERQDSKRSGSPIISMVKRLVSPYNRIKTNVLAKINRTEFMVGVSLFSMQKEKMETVFETIREFETVGEGRILGLRLQLETLTPQLCIDTTVVDCWSEILNHEERYRKEPCVSRIFFTTGCITEAMFDGTYKSYKEKFECFEAELASQFKHNVEALALKDVDLAFFPIRFANHFYVVVFRLTSKMTSMMILDNVDSGDDYDKIERYKLPCDLLKKMFAEHLQLYSHERHSKIEKLKTRIPKLKWSTEENVTDCGIFTMLHMENYMDEACSKWDFGLVPESKKQKDMIRLMRFKFATKIMLHEINIHAEKNVSDAEEFDKIGGAEKMRLVTEALKNRDVREGWRPVKDVAV